MIRPNGAIWGAALIAVRWAELARRQGMRATCTGYPKRAEWLARQAERWEEYIANLADESIREAQDLEGGRAHMGQ